MNLSTNAQRLFDFLKANGCKWESDCVKGLFPKPTYPGVSETPTKEVIDYWQWDVNLYGHSAQRPVSKNEKGEFVSMEFKLNIPVPYHDQTSAAYQELRKAGLADERNNGYNCYAFYLKK